MDYKSAIMQTVRTIDEHIKESISAEQLAEQVGYSHYYFRRLFMASTGVGLMAYVRGRKLSFARMDVTAGRRVLDIALDYGYGSARAFTRAYQAYFGITPSASRNLSYAMPRPLWVGSVDMSWMKGRMDMSYFSEVFYKELPAMNVVSMTRISAEPEEEGIEAMNAYLAEKGIRGTRQYGFDVQVSEAESSRGFRGYEYWSEVPGDYTDKSVEIKKVPGYKYATLSITDPFNDPFERIPGGWKTLVAWIESKEVKGTAPRNAACLEEVYEKDGVTYMDIMIPIYHI